MSIDEVKQYFEDNDYEESKEYIPVECTCRYGVTYNRMERFLWSYLERLGFNATMLLLGMS